MQRSLLHATLAGALGTGLLPAAPANAQSGDAATLPIIHVKPEAERDDGRLRAMTVEPPAATIDHAVTQPVTVVERQDIDRTNPLSTLDVLSRVPNVTVNRTGGIAGTIFLRGLNTNDMRVPMFIDGDRFRGRNTLQFMLIAPSEIEQVEVVRGPDSARFGSDGMGGLINFVTKRAHGNLDHPFSITGGEVSTTYQSNGHGVQATTAIEGSGDGFDLRAYATGRRASDYDSANGKVPNSDFRGASGGITLGYMPDARQRIEFSVRSAYVEAGLAGASPPYPQSVSRYAPLKVKQARLAYDGNFEGAAVSRLKASLYVDEFDTTLPTRTTTSSRVTQSYSHVIGPVATGGSVAATLRPWGDTQTTVGLDFMHERRPGSESRSKVTTATSVTSTDYKQTGPDTYQTNVGAFVTTEWKPTSRWTVTAGGRFDWFHSDVKLSPLPSQNLLPAFRAARNQNETATTGSLGLSYQATQVVELLGSVGTSFRMPWTSELFTSSYTGSSYTFPNPNLKPERGVNAEVGTRLHFEDASFGLTMFRSNYRNFIESVTTTYMGLPATQRQNVGRARIQGVETDWRWQLTRQWNVYGNASYLHATNRSTGTPLKSIAPLSGLLGLQYMGPGQAYALSGEMQWAKGQTRYDASSEYPSAGFGVVNLYAQFQLDRLGLPQLRNTQVVLGVNNVFDRAYRTAATSSNVAYAMTDLNPLLEPGRSVSLTLRTRF
ncbi:TonB-dependent receptor [Achromobacter aloeverae]